MNDEEYEKRVQSELTHLRKQEAEKALLYKRDPNALQPSVDFIKQCVGEQKTDTQLQIEARANAKKQRDTEIREARRSEWVEQQSRENMLNSQRRKEQFEAEQQQEKRSVMDILRQKRQNNQSQDRER